MNFVYKRTKFSPYCLYTVGHYDLKGRWYPKSYHDTSEEAAKSCNYLNGFNREEKKEVK